MDIISYGQVSSMADLKQILELQRQNVEEAISAEESKEQGFVTIHHSLDLLSRMNSPHPHIVAKIENRLIGYALVMGREFASEIKVLDPMFEKINSLEYKGKPLSGSSFFIMGQVCIEKEYRGRGIFYKLYDTMTEKMYPYYDYIITEVATRNSRSLQAHLKAGFHNILEYHSPDGEEWILLLKELRK